MAATGGAYLRQRLAVFSVALGTFTLVTNEFLPVALLTGIRTSLGVSQGRRPPWSRSRRWWPVPGPRRPGAGRPARGSAIAGS
jgi:hypothetical protein